MPEQDRCGPQHKVLPQGLHQGSEAPEGEKRPDLHHHAPAVTNSSIKITFSLCRKNVDDFTGPRERSDLGVITFDLSVDILLKNVQSGQESIEIIRLLGW